MAVKFLKSLPSLACLIGAWLVLAVPTGLSAQDAATNEATPKNQDNPAGMSNNPAGLSKEELSKRVKELEQQTQVSQKAVDVYEAMTKRVAVELKELNAKMANPPAELTVKSAEGLGDTEVENRVSAAMAAVTAAKTRVADISTEAATRAARKKAIPQELAQAELQLSQSGLPTAPLASASEEDKLRYQLLQFSQKRWQTRIAELSAEQRYYSASEELFALQEQDATLRATRLDKEYAFWTARQEKLRAREADKLKELAKKQVEKVGHIEPLAVIARRTTELIELQSQVMARSSAAQRSEAKMRASRKEIELQRTNAQERIRLHESTGIRIDTATGALLRRQRNELPTKKSLQKMLETNIQTLTQVQLQLLELKNELGQLPIDHKKQAAALYQSIEPNDGLDEKFIITLLDDRRSALKEVQKLDKDYVQVLKSLNQTTQEAIREVGVYSQYLDKRLLWIPSAENFSARDFPTEVTATKEFISNDIPGWWSNLRVDFSKRPVLWVLFFPLWMWLVARRSFYKRHLLEAAATIRNGNNTSIAPTFKAVGITLLLALPLPLLLAFLAWRVDSPGSMAYSLMMCACFFALFGSYRILAHPEGVLHRHFKISGKKVARQYRHLTWFVYLMPALLFVAYALPRSSQVPQAGRLAFLACMLVVFVFLLILLRPLLHQHEKSSSSRWTQTWQYGFYLSIPIALAVGSCFGYLTSVQTILLCLIATLGVALLVTFVVRFLLRWILVSRRHMVREQANVKYKAMLAKEKDAEETGNEPPSPSWEELETNALRPVAVEAQTKRLVKVGATVIMAFAFFGIWSPVLPAFSILDDIKVWGEKPASQEEAGHGKSLVNTLTGGGAEADTGKDSATTTQAEPQAEPAHAEPESKGVSLKDVLMTLLIIGLMFVAARNLPGLLELCVLRRLELQAGGNYAITTVLRYVIVVVGLLLAFGRIGINWSSVQWLAAAVTLGIGFGLQEIFANFVAGIILLFERPIRLGDVVTVGEVSGRVTQIKIRATTILQFNNKELLVPNKEFITGQLVNWTLRDSLLRFELPVGIAYGSDTALATRVLLEIADNNADVLDTPSPEVLFVAFGNSTLDFILRGYVASPEKLIQAQSSLHYQIDEGFRRAGIEIAFPQTDIHIKSMPLVGSVEEKK
ncbi:MAG: mechanosensitive ion channel [Akkermansiaceae bacterium]|nr:mechanosensitive ion channel [Akkermansiaceae bacterium]